MWQKRSPWCTSYSISTNVHGLHVSMYTAIFLCTGMVSVSHGVFITPIKKPVQATEKDASVTLPCNFTTHTYETPMITWFRQKNGEIRQIMKFENNRLTSYGELQDRVARGDRGALVLTKPTVGDSGNYSCEVEVEGESPNWVKAGLYLEIKLQGIRVTIKEVGKPVTATDSDSSVTLPCEFTTDLPVTPRIKWCLDKGGEKKHIMTCDKDGAISVNEKFLDRIARGEKGALVLISPNVEDSGTYTCVVQVDDNSQFTSNVSLSVTGDITITDSAYAGVVFLICVLWLIPVLCGFGLETGGVGKIKNIISQKIASQQRLNPSVLRDTECPTPGPDHPKSYTECPKLEPDQPVSDTGCPTLEPDHPISETGCPTPGKPGPEHPKLDTGCHTPQGVNERVGWRYIIIFLALCLIFSGTVCSAKALSSRGYTDFRHNQLAGYGIGIVGIVVLCGIYVSGPLIKIYKDVSCRKTSIQKDHEKSGDEPISVEVAPLVPNTETITPSHNEDAENLTSKIVANPTDEHVTDIHDELTTDFENLKMNSGPGEPSTTTVDGKEIQQVSESENTTLNSNRDVSGGNPKFQILDNPSNEKVTGMVSTSYKDVYVTTPSTLYHMDTTDVHNIEYPSSIDFNSNEELLMVCKHTQGVLLLAKAIDKTSTKYGVIAVRLTNKKRYRDYKEWPISCIFAEMDSDCIYITAPERTEVIRKEFAKNKMGKGKPIDTSVLKYPTCVCKNSRGEIIVTDSGRQDVFVFNESTGFVTSMKMSVPKDMEHLLKGCNRLTLGTDDRIYVTGPFTKQVLVFGADFRFERVIQTDTESRGVISCIIIHNNSLYVAHEDCIRVYPLDST